MRRLVSALTLAVILFLICHGESRGQFAVPILDIGPSTFFTCDVARGGLLVVGRNGIDELDCVTGGGTASPHVCVCDGTAGIWRTDPSVGVYVLLTGDTMTGALHIVQTGTPFSPFPATGLMVQRDGLTTEGASVLILGGSDSTSGIVMGDVGNEFAGRLLYQHVDDSMDFHTDGSLQMTLGAGGELGLGTGTPGAQFHILDGPTPFMALAGTQLLVQDSGGTGPILSLVSDPGAPNTSQLTFGDTDNQFVGRLLYDHDDDRMRFFAGGSEQFQFDGSTITYQGADLRNFTERVELEFTSVNFVTGVATTIIWTAELEDTDTMFGAGTTITIQTSGTYYCTVNLIFTDAGYPITGEIELDGITTLGFCTSQVDGTEAFTSCNVSLMKNFAASDTLVSIWKADGLFQDPKNVTGFFSCFRVQ